MQYIVRIGMADAARAGGYKAQAVLHCVSGYSALAADYNLRTIIPNMI